MQSTSSNSVHQCIDTSVSMGCDSDLTFQRENLQRTQHENSDTCVTQEHNGQLRQMTVAAAAASCDQWRVDKQKRYKACQPALISL